MSMEKLLQLWHRVAAGQATAAEWVDAILLTGRLGASQYTSVIRTSLGHADPEVRKYALLTLVRDIQEKDAETEARCWSLLSDPDPHVRTAAAACIGEFRYGLRDKPTFARLRAILQDSREPRSVRSAAYDSIFSVMGRPLTEWPSTRLLDEKDVDEIVKAVTGDRLDVDWSLLDEFERQLRE